MQEHTVGVAPHRFGRLGHDRARLHPAQPQPRPRRDHPLPHTRIVKVFLPLFDVELNTGPSAVVPLTHRLEEAPQQVATFGSAGGLQADRPGMEQAAMPNYIPFAVSCTTSLTSGLQSSQGDSDIVADRSRRGRRA